MSKKAIYILLLAPSVLVAYAVGSALGFANGEESAIELMTHPQKYWPRVVQLDKKLYADFNVENRLDSNSTYSLTLTFPGKLVETYTVELAVQSGKLTGSKLKTPNYVSGQYDLKGNVFALEICNMDEQRTRYVVGVIDQKSFRGKAYIPCSNGWDRGPAEVGICSGVVVDQKASSNQ